MYQGMFEIFWLGQVCFEMYRYCSNCNEQTSKIAQNQGINPEGEINFDEIDAEIEEDLDEDEVSRSPSPGAYA